MSDDSSVDVTPIPMSLDPQAEEWLRDLAKTVRNLEKEQLLLIGKHGNNGRFGNLSNEVSGFKKWLAGVAAAAAIACGGWVKSVYDKGQEDGALRLTVETNARTIEALKAELSELRADVWRRRARGEDQ